VGGTTVSNHILAWLNDEERLAKKYVNKVEMTKSIAGTIERIERAATLKKKDSTRALIQMSGDVRTKLTAKNGNVSKITKKEISAAMLLAYYYEKSVDEKQILEACCDDSDAVRKDPAQP
jgi:Zn-dependent M16 (insulinase) family peptidase